jgi:hypothetical protein
VLEDYRSATLSDAERLLFGFLEKVNRQSNQIRRSDVEELRRAGWSEEAIYHAITVCALFNFYNRWCDACGVQDMPALGYEMSGRRLATQGYAPGSVKQSDAGISAGSPPQAEPGHDAA